MATKSMTSNQIELAKKEAIQKQLIRKPVQIGDIRFVTSDTIEYCGLFLSIEKKALRDLTSYLGISERLEATFNENMGSEFTKKLIESLKDAIAKNKGGDLVMVIDRNRTVKRFIQDAGSMLSTESFFDQVDRIVDDSKLEIQRFNIDDSGNVSLSAINPNSEFGLAGLKDEYFQSGLNINNSINGMSVNPYMHRMICTNGIIGKQFNESINIKRFDKEQFEKLHTSIERLKAKNFQPHSFEQQVRKAIETPASIMEMLTATDLITSYSKIPEQEVKIFIDSNKTIHDYAKLGVDINKLNHEQMRNAKTNIPMWDLINGLTDFASHDYGYQVRDYDSNYIQRKAGDILCGTFDTSNLVPVQPY